MAHFSLIPSIIIIWVKKKKRTFDFGALLEGGVEGFLVQVFVTAAWVEQFQFCVHRKMSEA